jgi:hypothetical protein
VRFVGRVEGREVVFECEQRGGGGGERVVGE